MKKKAMVGLLVFVLVLVFLGDNNIINPARYT